MGELLMTSQRLAELAFCPPCLPQTCRVCSVKSKLPPSFIQPSTTSTKTKTSTTRQFISRPCLRRPHPTSSPSLPRTTFPFKVTPTSSNANRDINNSATADNITNSSSSDESDSILPKGTVTLVLRLKFKTHVTISDAHALLSEYARQTLRERGVLRCDVIFEVTKRRVAKGPYFNVWTTFVTSQSYIEHERTAHAAKLRIYLDPNPNAMIMDTATLLTKLAHQTSLLRPLYPSAAGWRSSLQHEEDEEDDNYNNYGPTVVRKNRIGGGAPTLGDAIQKSFPSSETTSTTTNSNTNTSATETNTVRSSNSHSGSRNNDNDNGKQNSTTNSQRRKLNDLISSVGLQDVIVQSCEATAISSEHMRTVRESCEQYLRDMERSAGVIRTGLLIDRANPLRIILLSIHDVGDEAGVFFDLELAVDSLVENTFDSSVWTVRRYASVFPDKIGWERYIDDEEAVRLGFYAPSTNVVKTSTNSSSTMSNSSWLTTTKTPGTLTKGSAIPKPNVPGYRLLFGHSAFNDLKRYIRETSKVSTGECRIVIFVGWNQARSQPLLHQLEYDRNVDVGRINYVFAPSTVHGALTPHAIRLAVECVREHNAHVLLAYGGGTVMDMVKIVARLSRLSIPDLNKVLETLEVSLVQNYGRLTLPQLPCLPLPTVLIPSALGPAVELTDFSVVRMPITSPHDTSEKRLQWNHIFLSFTEQLDISTAASYIETPWKTILVDSRVVAPRRLEPPIAGQAALYIACCAIDAYLCASIQQQQQQDNIKKTDAFDDITKFSLQATGLGVKNVRYALREPIISSGESRDTLMKAVLALGLAQDALGRPGIASRIAHAVLNAIFPERLDYAFRHVMIRITIALVSVTVEREENVGLERVAMAMDVNGVKDIVRILERRADECDFPLLPRVGLARRRVPMIAKSVVHHLKMAEVSYGPFEETFMEDSALVERVLYSALDQKYEL